MRRTHIEVAADARRRRLLSIVLLVATWVVVGTIATLDAIATRDYVDLLDDSGTLPVDSLPLQRVAPADYADALTWTRLALAEREGAPWRVRHTDIDNAPEGRPVYWNSAFVHLIAAAGRIESVVTGAPVARATEQSLAWFNLPLFLLVVILFSTWVTSRIDLASGVLIAFGMLGFEWFYLGFAPNYVDHHGLLEVATFGLVLGAVFMGAGWRCENSDARSLVNISRRRARRSAIVSALFGGFGLWISAASVVPTIAIIGGAALVVSLVFGAHEKRRGTLFDPSVWRVWGLAGCIASLIAYAAEFAPAHLSMRLEVNHPLYAIAWLGGAELVALVGEWRADDRRPPTWRTVLAVVAVTSPLIVIAVEGSRVFIPIDAGTAELHRGIGEFQSLAAYVRVLGLSTAWRFVTGFALLLPAALTLRTNQRDRLVVGFASLTAVAAVALGCWQIRWWLTASGAELALLLIALVSTFDWTRVRTTWLVSLTVSGAFAAKGWYRAHTTRENVDARSVTQADALQPLYRDAASAIRASDPGAQITLLSTPTASMAIGYFGRFRTVSSFYWENMQGNRAAAAILSSASDDSALAMIQARGITHVAAIAADNSLNVLFELPTAGAHAKTLAAAFGSRLLDPRQSPRWLRPIPFHPRFPDRTDTRAFLYQVVPDQTDLDAAWNVALAELAVRNDDVASAEFERAAQVANPARRAVIYENAGRVAYEAGAHRLAVHLLRSAMKLHPSRDVTLNLAWIRATSADDSVRDGRAALDAATDLVKQDPGDVMAVDVLAASLAETGRFADAVATMRNLRESARQRGDSATEERALSRLRSYVAGRPWRQ